MTTGVVTTSFPRHAGDFAGCFVEDAVRASASAATGERIEVIAAGVGDSPHERHDLPPGVKVFRVAMPTLERGAPLFFGDGAPETLEQGGATAWFQALLFWLRLCQRIRDRAGEWDRVTAHWLVPCGLAAHAVAPHLPLTAHAHSGDVALLERIPGGSSLARRLALATADLIFVSADLRARFGRLAGVATGRVLPAMVRGVSPQTAAPSPAQSRTRARATLNLSRTTILSVGRLVPIKGFDVLLRAVAQAGAQAGPGGRWPATVVILGEGPERDRLESMAANLGVDLRLPGVVARRAVAEWMAAVDLYAQPSRRLTTGRTEGLPVATLEALAARLPVIASRTGGLAELQDHPGLRLVPPDDAAALAAVLLADVS